MRGFEPAHQPLRQQRVDGGGDQVVLDAHVAQAGQATAGGIGVQRGQHQVAGQRRLDRGARGLDVAHFADQDDVRVLAHDRAQGAGEIQPDLRLDLDLVDAVHPVFHRVLDGDDLDPAFIELGQRRVQRGGLAGAGRPGHQHDAVRLRQRLAQPCALGVGVAERAQVQADVLAVEQAQHHRFAMRGRHGGHAQVEFAALHAQLDAAVLRQPAFGDVEPGEDLEAAHHRRRHRQRRRVGFLQHAVHAVAQFHLALERLQVDVGCAQFHRALQHLVDDADHRRFRGQVLEVLHVVEVGAGIGGLVVARGFGFRIPLRQQRGDRRARRHLQGQRAAQRQRERIQRRRQPRVRRPHFHRLIHFRHRDQLELAQEARRDIGGIGRRFRRVGGLGQRQVHRLGGGARVVGFGQHAQPFQQRQQRHRIGVAPQRFGAADVVGLEPAALKQGVDDAGLVAHAGLEGPGRSILVPTRRAGMPAACVILSPGSRASASGSCRCPGTPAAGRCRPRPASGRAWPPSGCWTWWG